MFGYEYVMTGVLWCLVMICSDRCSMVFGYCM